MSSLISQSLDFLKQAASSPEASKLAQRSIGSGEPGSLRGPLIVAGGVVLAQIALLAAERYTHRSRSKALSELRIVMPPPAVVFKLATETPPTPPFRDAHKPNSKPQYELAVHVPPKPPPYIHRPKYELAIYSLPPPLLVPTYTPSPVFLVPTPTSTLGLVTLAHSNVPVAAMGCAAAVGMALLTVVIYKRSKPSPPDPLEPVIDQYDDDDDDDRAAEAPPPPPPPPPPPAGHGARRRRRRRQGCCSWLTLFLLNVVPTLVAYGSYWYAGPGFYDFLLSLVFRTRLSVSWIITFIITPIVVFELAYLALRWTWWCLKSVLWFTIWANWMSIVLPWKACMFTLRIVKRIATDSEFCINMYLGVCPIVALAYGIRQAAQNPQSFGHGLVTSVASSIAKLNPTRIDLHGLAARIDSHYDLSPRLINGLRWVDQFPVHAKGFALAHPFKAMRITFKITRIALKIIRVAGDLYTSWRYLDIGTAFCIVVPVLLWFALRLGIVRLPFVRNTPAMKKLSEDVVLIQGLLASIERGGNDVAAAQMALTELMQGRLNEWSTIDRMLAQVEGHRQDDHRREALPLGEDYHVDDGRYITYAETVYYRAPALHDDPGLQTPPPLYTEAAEDVVAA